MMNGSGFILFFVFCKIISINAQFYRSKGCGSPNPPLPNTTTEQFLQHNNIQRSYLIHLPPTYVHTSNQGLPVILNLHEFTSNAWIRMSGSLMNQHSDQNNYIAVYPQGTSYGMSEINGQMTNLTSWNDLSCSGSPSLDGPTCSQPIFDVSDVLPVECKDIFQCNWCNCKANDIDFIINLLNHLESRYCIDRSRLYSTGFSNGGMMTQRLGCELNNRLAAIAPIHGQAALGYNCGPIYEDIKMPIINIWGTNDNIVSGDTISNPNGGFYFTSVYQVMYKYGLYNKCDVNKKRVQAIETVSDGILEWKCVGYNECNIDNVNSDGYGMYVMSCSWNGSHVYPVFNNENFGLNVVWNFFKNHTKVPDQLKTRKKNDIVYIPVGIIILVVLIVILGVIVWRFGIKQEPMVYDNFHGSTKVNFI
eukprot:226533_1